MIELLENDGDGVLALRATGVLTGDDYRDVLLPEIRAAVAGSRRLRVLVLLDEGFRGWNARAAWLNTCLDLRHRRDLARVAVVGAPRWEEWCVRLADVLVAGTVRAYRGEQLDDAWDWVRAPA